MGKVIEELNKRKINFNITAVYKPHKLFILKKLINQSKVIISIFAGRMADCGIDLIPEFKKV